MSYRFAADAVLLLHAAFILFVVFGGLLAWRWPRLAWVHLPAAAWGVWIELSGGACPLTGVENAFRAEAGLAGYEGGFIEHYVLAAIYPAALTRPTQYLLGALVLVVNAAIYGALLHRRRARQGKTGDHG